jgi:hypothetical protein
MPPLPATPLALNPSFEYANPKRNTPNVELAPVLCRASFTRTEVTTRAVVQTHTVLHTILPPVLITHLHAPMPGRA